MGYEARKPAVLLLQDGTVFHGRSTGLEGTAWGEICFNTGMTGYQEIFTDPSYFGQLMVTATAHIGNYGVSDEEVESEDIKIAGLVCKNFSTYQSRPSADGTLYDYFRANNKVAICDVDTRALVRHIRDAGAMNAIISSETTDIAALKAKLDEVPGMEGLELSSRVSAKEPYVYGSDTATYRIAALDFGFKRNILRLLAERDCQIKVYPWDTPAGELIASQPDGIFLSNGPGDPAAMSQAVTEVTKLIDSGIPVFGICMGHQLIALASGLRTYKMHTGHRGINHPVKNLKTGKGEITSQNHGFAVMTEDVEKAKNVELTHVHLNDQSVAGIRRTDKPCFSVQYHPEAGPGPHDARYLFDQFVDAMKSHKTTA